MQTSHTHSSCVFGLSASAIFVTAICVTARAGGDEDVGEIATTSRAAIHRSINLSAARRIIFPRRDRSRRDRPLVIVRVEEPTHLAQMFRSTAEARARS